MIASYHAGTEGNPAVAPSPDSPAGGGWGLVNTTAGDVNFSAGAVSPDGATGLNAWRVLDNSTVSSRFLYYSNSLSSAQLTEALNNGWRLSARLRVVDPVAANGGSWSVYMSLGTLNGRRFTIFFDIDAEGDLAVNIQGTDGAIFKVTTNAVGALDYHLHELVFDPVTRSVSYLFDGVTRLSNALGLTQTRNALTFGAESSGGRGDGYWNSVVLEIFDPPPAPVVVRDPLSSTNSVGDSLSLSAAFTNTVLNYQWFKDGTPIDGATNATYVIPFVTVLDAGTYLLRASNTAGSADTAPATVTVLPDVTPPGVTQVTVSIFAARLRLRFSEPVTVATAAEAFNYSVQNDLLSVTSASLRDRFTVDLLLANRAVPGSNYVLLVSYVEDDAGNAMAPNTPVPFTAPDGYPAMEQLLAAFDGTSAVPHPIDGVSWLDRSGNEHHAVNPNPATRRRPTLVPDGLNGHDTVSFHKASQQWLLIDAVTATGLGGDAFTWFAVAKPTNFVSTPNVLRHQSTLHNANWGSFFFAGDSSTGNQRALTSNGRIGTSAFEARVFPVPIDEWQVVCGFVDGPGGEIFSRVWVPGSDTAVSGTNTTVQTLSFGTPIATWIGGTGHNAGHSYDGEMAEVLLYSGVLSEADRSAVEEYLRRKYFSAPPSLQIRSLGANLELEFTGVLQSASEVTGPWEDVIGGPSSPVVLTPASLGDHQFFRARRP